MCAVHRITHRTPRPLPPLVQLHREGTGHSWQRPGGNRLRRLTRLCVKSPRLDCLTPHMECFPTQAGDIGCLEDQPACLPDLQVPMSALRCGGARPISLDQKCPPDICDEARYDIIHSCSHPS